MILLGHLSANPSLTNSLLNPTDGAESVKTCKETKVLKHIDVEKNSLVPPVK